MVINLIGDCDKRPVLYTLMKICQGLGDVLMVTSSSRLIRLSDTKETYGHYQNTMIAVTQEGIDDFFSEFMYHIGDFDFTIIDNIISAEADFVIYVKGMVESEEEKDNLEYIENYETIQLFNGKYINDKTLLRCEEFEACKTMCPINNKLAETIAIMLAKQLNVDPKNLVKIALEPTSTHMSALPKDNVQKGSKFGFGKRG